MPGVAALSRRAKRVIYLFNSGGPSQMDLFDYKPKLQELRGTDLPESVRMGQRLTGMTSGRRVSGRAVGFQIRPAWPERTSGSASCCRTRRRSPTNCASSSRCTPRRSTTIRRSRFSNRLADRRPAEHRLVVRLRAGQREQGSAGIRRDGFTRQGQRPTAGRSQLGQRVSCPPNTRACASERRRTGAYLAIRRARPPAAARMLDRAERAESIQRMW